MQDALAYRKGYMPQLKLEKRSHREVDAIPAQVEFQAKEPHPDACYTEKICSHSEAKEFINSGWAAADLHVHTWCSHDVLPLRSLDPLELYKKARQMGCRFVTFTDHDTMDAYDRVGWTREGIVPGVEIKILDPKRVGHTLHINVYELDKKQFFELERIAGLDKNLETFITYLKENDLCYSFNHPFWHEQDEKPCLEAIFEIADWFPVIEYNMGRVDSLNRQAMELAGKLRAGIIACTDTHTGSIGSALTLARGETFREYFNEIKAGRSYIVPQNMTIKSLMDEVNFRLKYLIAREKWDFDKPGFTIESGIKIVDGLVDMLVRSKSSSQKIGKKIVKLLLSAVNQTRIPASLYIRKQQNLAARIKELSQELANTTIPALSTISAA